MAESQSIEQVVGEDALWILLDDDMNQRGIEPEVPFRDEAGRPGIAWLTEVGGDEVAPVAVYLGGERAECPEIIEAEWSMLLYPLTVFLPVEVQRSRTDESHAAETSGP